MKKATDLGLVLVTVPNAKVGRLLARKALEAKLVACANLVPAVESHYWWEGRIDRSRELLVIFKTARSRLARLEALVLENHPYDTPEFIYVPVASATEKYLSWWQSALERPRR